MGSLCINVENLTVCHFPGQLWPYCGNNTWITGWGSKGLREGEDYQDTEDQYKYVGPRVTSNSTFGRDSGSGHKETCPFHIQYKLKHMQTQCRAADMNYDEACSMHISPGVFCNLSNRT